MTGFDVVVLLLGASLIVYGIRQEMGRTILDLVATFGALHIAARCSHLVAGALFGRPLPGSDPTPMAFGLTFGAAWLAGMALSWFVHRMTRLSLQPLDPILGIAGGLAIAVILGHVMADVSAQLALAKSDELPPYLANSRTASELRTFRSYGAVLDYFHRAQNGDAR